MSWLCCFWLTVSFNIWNDNQHCRYTHAQSLKPCSPDTLYQKPKSSSTPTHLQLLASAANELCWKTAVPSLRLPSPFLSLPIHSPIFLSREAPQIHFRGGREGGLMLAGREHHLLLFSKTEQNSTSLSWTELDMQLDLMWISWPVWGSCISLS